MAETRPKLNITSLHSLYVPVSNARSTANWYMRHFGMEEVASSNEQVTIRLAVGASLVLKQSERLNLYQCNPFHFKCNDARKAHASLDKLEVRASEPVNWHHYVDFNFKDPDGNPVSVISEPSWALHPNNFFRMDGIFIGASDFESSLAWYLNVLGVEIEYDFTVETSSSPEARMCCLRGVPITVFDSPLSFIQGRFCEFRTNDAKADHVYLRRNGIAVTDLIAENDTLIFAFYDPEGREFGMIQLS
ncbi:hypothetical protein ACFPPD_00915 [Cohnella suwonensis]|uniref:VOC domain-containing protein n=1 Tax=Cohnella suwonensis TaxID=696072 RepID=A0ABW0LPQ4_9BACL